jgi:hypothetical protein
LSGAVGAGVGYGVGATLHGVVHWMENAGQPDAVNSANTVDASSKNQWPPCKTVSGKVVPVGTLAYRPLDIPPPGKIQHGIAGRHYNIYRANQNPNNGQCFLQPVGTVKPSYLPPDAIPIEPFAP